MVRVDRGSDTASIPGERNLLTRARPLARLLAAVAAAVAIAVPALDAQPRQTAPAPRRAPAEAAAERRAAARLARIREDPPALRAFLRAMPKGADLHTHLGGAVYAESYIQWAADLPLCIDLSTFAFVEGAKPSSPGANGSANGSTLDAVTCTDAARQRPAADVLRDPVLYRNAIDALSTRHWRADHAVGHYDFFDAFRKFRAVAFDGTGPAAPLIGRAVAEVTQRAALQNILHLELMLSVDAGVELPPADVSWDTDTAFAGLRARMLESGLHAGVDRWRQWFDAVGAQARATLRCDTPSPMPGCDISVRFIATAPRGLPPREVFAQSLFAFELAAADPRIVGVNLVMPEDGYVSMRDHALHMRMFRFFRAEYPGVHVSLHAGELAFGLVPPETLGLHVRQAVEIGGAERIGHGTDVMYDADPEALLREMARRGVAVEISLTSSDVILGVRGPKHPMRQFLRAGVPVVIATDDEGVARSDLTNELQRAVEEQEVSYPTLKKMSRDSIDHSFLSPEEKARLRKQLDTAFVRFEAGLP